MNGVFLIPESFTTRKAQLDWVERTNQVTHGFAAVVSLLAAVVLIHAAAEVGDSWLTTGCVVYGISLVLVYLASALSHSFRRGKLKHAFRTLDQVCIFLMIAGNYTPVGLTVARDWWPVLAAMWVLALAGIITKLFITGIQNVPVWFYILVGWMPLLTIKPVIEQFPVAGLIWIVLGGGFYTSGTFFLANDDRGPLYHPVWHLMVMAGSACHFVVIYEYLVPMMGRA